MPLDADIAARCRGHYSVTTTLAPGLPGLARDANDLFFGKLLPLHLFVPLRGRFLVSGGWLKRGARQTRRRTGGTEPCDCSGANDPVSSVGFRPIKCCIGLMNGCNGCGVIIFGGGDACRESNRAHRLVILA